METLEVQGLPGTRVVVPGMVCTSMGEPRLPQATLVSPRLEALVGQVVMWAAVAAVAGLPVFQAAEAVEAAQEKQMPVTLAPVLAVVLAELSAAGMAARVRLPLAALRAVVAVTPILLILVPEAEAAEGVALLMVGAEVVAAAAVAVEQAGLAEPVIPAMQDQMPHTTVFLLPAVQTTQ